MYKKKILSSILFFIIGIGLFWLVYRNMDFRELKNSLKQIRFGWIFISIGFGLLSHLLRAERWRMLINTMNYRVGITNLFLSVLVLYFTNLIIPRGGEISRCAVISRYEKVPFVKLIGTVFFERLTDFIAFAMIFLILLVWQFDFFKTVLNYPEFQFSFSSFHIRLLPAVLITVLIFIVIYLILKYRIFNWLILKLRKLKGEFIEGLSVIIHMKGRLRFIVYTFLIFLLWLLMLYAVFFAYPPTDRLSFIVAVITYTFGTLAYLLPIQAGIGSWHFIVISCLFFYGIDKETGMIFALIAHTFTSLIFLIFGPIALALLPLVNGHHRRNQTLMKFSAE